MPVVMKKRKGKDEMFVEDNIEDWYQEHLKNKRKLESEDDIVALRVAGVMPMEAGRELVVSIGLGEAPETLMDPTKLLLNQAAARAIQVMIKRRRVTITAPNGKEFTGRELIAPTRTDDETNAPDDGDNAVVYHHDKAALGRATAYLERTIPGHIWGRLLIIAEHEGDLYAVADMISEKVDEMIGRLMEPATE